MSTPLTDDQYAELVCVLENMRSVYARGFPYQPQQLLRDGYENGWIGAWALVYLTQWFGRVGQNSAHIPHMVAELCEERTNDQPCAD